MRTLTYGSDKLPALSGVSREFLETQASSKVARLSNQVGESPSSTSKLEKPQLGTYVAGLWTGRFLEHLCWQNETCRLGYDPPSRRRPTEYRAPSWAWASIDDPIAMGWYVNSYMEPMAQIVDVSCVPANPKNIYGEVVSGFLCLQAPLVRLTVRVHRRGYNGNAGYDVVTTDLRCGVSLENVSFDILEAFDEAESKEEGIEVACAVLHKPETWGDRGTCLMLRDISSDDDKVFERLGIGKIRFSDPNPSDSIEKELANFKSRIERQAARKRLTRFPAQEFLETSHIRIV